MPQAFTAKKPTGVSLENPGSYRFMSGERAPKGEMSETEKSYRELNQGDPEMTENSGGTIGSISGPVKHQGSALDFLERTALDAQVSSDKILGIAKQG